MRAQALIEARDNRAIRLVFQGGGPGTAAAKSLAQQLALQRCEWKPYVAEEALVASLLKRQVLAVTQRPETRGLLWPSKLGLITALPRPILFIGTVDGAIASDLRRLPQSGIFARGDHEGVATWLEAQCTNRIAITNLADPSRHRSDALSLWLKLIERK